MIRTRQSDEFMHIQQFRETISEKVHATIAKGIIVDGFWVHCSSEKFERMARETMEVRLRMINESNKSIGSTASYSARDRALIMLIFSNNLSRDSRMQLATMTTSFEI